MGKTFFGLSLQSVAKTIIAAVTAASMVLTGMGILLDLKMQTVDTYIANQAVRSIEKQYYKITDTPEDIKPMDLCYAIDDYKSLPAKYKSQSLNTKSNAIEMYYLRISGGIK